jgi:hypothetical protein
MSDTPIPRFRLDSPGDIAQLVPYLIGFTPEESLAIVAIADNQVQVTARADLTDMQQWGAPENLLDRIWAQFPDANAFLIAYTQDPEAGWAVLDRCTDHLPTSALQLTMLVNQDTWQLPDGSHGLVEQSGRVATAVASHGYQRLAHRADLEARFVSAPDSPALDAAVLDALDDLPKYRDLTALLDHTRDLLHRNLHSRAPFDAEGASQPMSTADAVQLTRLVQNRHARDFVLASITKATAPRHLALWSEVLNRTPSRFAEVPAAIAGIAAWISGDGASANIALTRAQSEAHSPRESGPADLLEAILDRVVPPSAWPSVRGLILEHADQRVHHALPPHTRPEQTAEEGIRAAAPAPEQHRSHSSPYPGPTL